MRLKRRRPHTSTPAYRQGQPVDVLTGPISGRPATFVAARDGIALVQFEQIGVAARALREWDIEAVNGSLEALEAAPEGTGVLITPLYNIRPSREGRNK